MYGGCKSNKGNSKSCDRNLILYPGTANRSEAGNECLTGGPFADSYFFGNDCIASAETANRPPVPLGNTPDSVYRSFGNR